ncbi:ribosomal protein S18-alanine N-acetyltransferase [Sneathiella sp.]|uniref:ribosomal protein S18-alanine N-acetyltransferase n=1 Tax=Sneathiella sp. TaxID=1964365 RepID=UPI003567E562
MALNDIDIDFMEGIACAALAAKMHAECFSPAWDEASCASAMTIPGTVFQLMSLGDEPVAFALYRCLSGEAELLSLGVLPEYQHRGYAGILLDHGIERLVASAVHLLFLDVGVENLWAQQLYRSRGFIEIGRRKDYYTHGAGLEDAITMKRVL